MDEPKPNRSWRKKRWLIGLPLWLALAYAVSAGPAIYAMRYGWLPLSVAHFVYDPLNEALHHVPGAEPALGWYLRWWRDLP